VYTFIRELVALIPFTVGSILNRISTRGRRLRGRTSHTSKRKTVNWEAVPSSLNTRGTTPNTSSRNLHIEIDSDEQQ